MAWLRRQVLIYGAFAANIPKMLMAYNLYFWSSSAVSISKLLMMMFFWRALFSSHSTIGGMGEEQAVNYILWAQIFAPMAMATMIGTFGGLVGNGQVGMELLRPVDMQFRFYVEQLAGMAMTMVRDVLLMVAVAWLFLGLTFPSDPRVWAAAGAALLLGGTVLFAFDWAFCSLAFYTTEIWGLMAVREGIVSFFSGALLPLTMLPGSLKAIASALPFAQGLYAPVALFTGLIPLSAAWSVLRGQAIWAVALLVLSRFVFARAVKTVTVQGG